MCLRRVNVCPGCGGEKHFQSKLCRSCFLKESGKKNGYRLRRCVGCGKFFTTHLCQLEKGHGKFCSRSCHCRYQPIRKRRRALLTCQTCGTVFERHLCEVERSNRRGVFCSSDCWYVFNSGEQNTLWGGGQNARRGKQWRWRRLILGRDHGICRLCHSTGRVEAHHIYPYRSFPDRRWDVSNGLTLCYVCHKKLGRDELVYAERLAIVASVPLEVWG